MSDIKQVIIVRKDLNMRKGKMIAQGAHAAISAFINASTCFKMYNDTMCKKICVSVNSEEELIKIYELAEGLPRSLVIDSGLTEFHGKPTKTAVAIGPWYQEEIDKITGNLPLV